MMEEMARPKAAAGLILSPEFAGQKQHGAARAQRVRPLVIPACARDCSTDFTSVIFTLECYFVANSD